MVCRSAGVSGTPKPCSVVSRATRSAFAAAVVERRRVIELTNEVPGVCFSPRLEIRRRGAGRTAARDSRRRVVDLREERLEQQMQQQVVAAEVDDERDRRPRRARCRRSSCPGRRRCTRRRRAGLPQRRHDVQVRALVRDQVVGVEVPARFRERGDRAPRTCRRRGPARGAWRAGSGRTETQRDANATGSGPAHHVIMSASCHSSAYGRGKRVASRHAAAGPPLHAARAATCPPLHPHRGHHADARHRRNDDDLQRRERGHPDAAAVRPSPAARVDRRAQRSPEPAAVLRVVRELPVVEARTRMRSTKWARSDSAATTSAATAVSRNSYRARRSTTSVLSVLGLRPLAGRDFRAGDAVAGAPRVVLISEGLWHRRFGADPSVDRTAHLRQLERRGGRRRRAGRVDDDLAWRYLDAAQRVGRSAAPQSRRARHRPPAARRDPVRRRRRRWMPSRAASASTCRKSRTGASGW